MQSKTFFTFLLLISISCNTKSNNGAATASTYKIHLQQKENINTYPSIAAIPLPAGYKKIETISNSFAAWLQQVNLKKDKTVYLFNGDRKANQSAQFAVLDISTGDKDLQQSADAVMRLRAEYLFAVKKYDSIFFTDNEGKSYHFTEPYNSSHLNTYLQTVFGMCGSASLSKQLHPADIKNIQVGDVLIRGGFPGHAMIVIEVAMNETGKKIFMLAQSYMPAQDIHVLLNPVNTNLSPWYDDTGETKIYRPEYVFAKNELKRWL